MASKTPRNSQNKTNAVSPKRVRASHFSAAARPELMVLGNSLAQGVQTLSFYAALGRQSIGSRLAEINGWAFRAGDHEKPLLLDFEEEVRQLDIWDLLTARAFANDLARRVTENIEWWKKRLFGGPRPHEGFDNIGIAQTLIVDLSKPASAWRSGLEQLLAGFRLTGEQLLGLRDLSPLLDIYLGINASYVLNPGNEEAKMAWSAVDWVRARRPRRLLVSIGHNEALYEVGFNGVARLIRYEQLAGLETLARQIAACEVDQVIWDLLPKAGAVASLEPLGRWSIPADARHTAYADSYRTVLTGGTLTGQDLKDVDDSIRATNEQIRARLGPIFRDAGREIIFVDDYQFLEEIDFKNEPDKESAAAARKRLEFTVKIQGKERTVRADNRFAFADYRPDPDWTRRGAPPGILTLVQGGTFSGDGMHASGLGYMHKALHLQRQLGLDPADDSARLSQAYRECEFLSRFPTELNTVRLVLNAIRGGGGASGRVADPALARTEEEKTVMMVGHLMGTLCRPA